MPIEASRASGGTPSGNPEDDVLPVEGAEPGSGRRDLAGLAIAVALFLLAALIFRDAFSYPIRRSYAQFGPEIFPYIVGVGIAVIALLTVFSALRGGFPVREPLNRQGVTWVIGAILAEIALLYAGAGFVLASGGLFGLSARGFGRRPLALTVLVGIAVSAILYLLFRHGLGLALPAGPVERLLDAPFR